MKNSKRLIIVITFFIVTFLSLNIYFSQTISPLFSGMVNGNKMAVIEYLKKIKSQPQFNNELELYKKTYGVEIENMVFEDERVREEKIARYKSILQKNPRSRDLLYGLYLLYKSSGDNMKAEEYLNRAKEIDPNIK